tara:strand:- start:1970 stop:2245 length:276 start_codon:yes stop_codon:yes gene_type:complete
MDIHKAIRSIHSEAVTINGNNQNDIIAKDINGDEVTIDWTQVNGWTDSEQYKLDRKKEYPSIEDQLDHIYHNGINSWKATIKTTKDKYPKE